MGALDGVINSMSKIELDKAVSELDRIYLALEMEVASKGTKSFDEFKKLGLSDKLKKLEQASKKANSDKEIASLLAQIQNFKTDLTHRLNLLIPADVKIRQILNKDKSLDASQSKAFEKGLAEANKHKLKQIKKAAQTVNVEKELANQLAEKILRAKNLLTEIDSISSQVQSSLTELHKVGANNAATGSLLETLNAWNSEKKKISDMLLKAETTLNAGQPIDAEMGSLIMAAPGILNEHRNRLQVALKEAKTLNAGAPSPKNAVIIRFNEALKLLSETLPNDLNSKAWTNDQKNKVLATLQFKITQQLEAIRSLITDEIDQISSIQIINDIDRIAPHSLKVEEILEEISLLEKENENNKTALVGKYSTLMKQIEHINKDLPELKKLATELGHSFTQEDADKLTEHLTQYFNLISEDRDRVSEDEAPTLEESQIQSMETEVAAIEKFTNKLRAELEQLQNNASKPKPKKEADSESESEAESDKEKTPKSPEDDIKIFNDRLAALEPEYELLKKITSATEKYINQLLNITDPAHAHLQGLTAIKEQIINLGNRVGQLQENFVKKNIDLKTAMSSLNKESNEIEEIKKSFFTFQTTLSKPKYEHLINLIKSYLLNNTPNKMTNEPLEVGTLNYALWMLDVEDIKKDPQGAPFLGLKNAFFDPNLSIAQKEEAIKNSHTNILMQTLKEISTGAPSTAAQLATISVLLDSTKTNVEAPFRTALTGLQTALNTNTNVPSKLAAVIPHLNSAIGVTSEELLLQTRLAYALPAAERDGYLQRLLPNQTVLDAVRPDALKQKMTDLITATNNDASEKALLDLVPDLNAIPVPAMPEIIEGQFKMALNTSVASDDDRLLRDDALALTIPHLLASSIPALANARASLLDAVRARPRVGNVIDQAIIDVKNFSLSANQLLKGLRHQIVTLGNIPERNRAITNMTAAFEGLNLSGVLDLKTKLNVLKTNVKNAETEATTMASILDALPIINNLVPLTTADEMVDQFKFIIKQPDSTQKENALKSLTDVALAPTSPLVRSTDENHARIVASLRDLKAGFAANNASAIKSAVSSTNLALQDQPVLDLNKPTDKNRFDFIESKMIKGSYDNLLKHFEAIVINTKLPEFHVTQKEELEQQELLCIEMQRNLKIYLATLDMRVANGERIDALARKRALATSYINRASAIQSAIIDMKHKAMDKIVNFSQHSELLHGASNPQELQMLISQKLNSFAPSEADATPLMELKSSRDRSELDVRNRLKLNEAKFNVDYLPNKDKKEPAVAALSTQIVDGDYAKTTIYVKEPGEKDISQDGLLLLVITAVENQKAYSTRPITFYGPRMSAETKELIQTYCEHMGYNCHDALAPQNVSGWFSKKPFEPSKKDVANLRDRIKANPEFFLKNCTPADAERILMGKETKEKLIQDVSSTNVTRRPS